MTELVERVKALSPDKRALYERLLAERRAADRLAPRGDVGSAPASFAQERLWFLAELEPGNPFYNTPVAVELTGALDVRALEGALTAIVERHEVLRTRLEWQDGALGQVVGAPHAPLERMSVEGLSEEQVLRRAAADARRPFELARGPLLRATLYRRSATSHVLLLTLHHAVVDGWSVGVMLKELAALYRAGHAQADASLPPLLIQYGDYATWQRHRMQGEAAAGLIAHWRGALAGAPQVIELPLDNPRPLQPSFKGGSVSAVLPQELASAVTELGRRESATLFMTLLAAFGTLLARLSGQSDLLLGSPIANRTRHELEALVGCFVNTLVLRVDLRGDPGFRALLRRVRAFTLDAYAHQDLPFERLVEELKPERRPGRNPLFQAFMAVHNAPMPDVELPSLTLRRLDVPVETAKFELSLAFQELPQGLAATLEYDQDLFEAPTAARLLGQLETLLRSAVAEPDRRVSQLPLAGPVERQRLAAWNDTARAYPEAASTLHALVEAQVQRTPAAEAVHFEGETLRYDELNRRANRLAHRLRRLGVGPDARVGVVLERSLEMVVALLATLKAGGAYVPIDPSYPRERVQFLLEDADVPVLLTQERLRGSLPPHQGQTLCLDGADGQCAAEPDGDPQLTLTPDQLAYVIYTSGSTGQPKGAMNTHGAICNRLLWMQEAYGLDGSDRVLQKTPFSFDVSVWEFFWPLITGARLIVAAPGAHKDAAALVQTIREQQVTTLHFVPSMLQLFLEEDGAASCTSLRRVVCSGEALACDLQQRFFDRMSAELHNLYGPTEAAVDVTSWACRPRDARRLVPIGHPIANTQIHILDRGLNPLPVGVPGELYIGGVSLARGYLGRPDLTAARFVPDPFSPRPGARLYRTGDLARRLADGSIDFLGRLDQQVKIRGFRIELGEIEAALREHPGVADAALAVRTDAAGDRALVAYVAPRGDVLPSDLRARLQARLPEHMVPAAFVALGALPLSPNGKLDRAALPAPVAAEPAARRTATDPRNSKEAALVQLWKEILGATELGIDDDFFEWGGDSFKAIRAARSMGIPVRELFLRKTIRGILDGQGQAPSASTLVELRAPGGSSPVTWIAVPYGGGSALCYHPLAAALPESHGLLALDPPGHDAGRPGEALLSFEALADAALEGIAKQADGPLAIYGHCVGSALAVEIARRLEAQGREPRAVVVGGFVPPRAQRLGRLHAAAVRLRQRLTSDEAMTRRLRELGGFEQEVDGPAQALLLAAFRADVQNALAYFSGRVRSDRLRAPLYCVTGDDDPFTRGHAAADCPWHGYAADVRHHVLPAAGHYFVKHDATALAALLERCREAVPVTS
jgi:amino acid adenylation domain-containing protein